MAGTAQMSLLRDLPFSLCQAGPHQNNGVGNYYLQVLSHSSSKFPVSDIYLLDSHGQIPSDIEDPDYDPIKRSQIEWFKSTSQALRKDRKADNGQAGFHASLAFLHIPLPEFGDETLDIRSGHRREPTEGASLNTHFYDALAEEGVAAIGCGHDHVNDFCALLPPKYGKGSEQDHSPTTQHSPWLCYGGGSGFGGYCSYGKKNYRGTRAWELDTTNETIKTWKRVEYAQERVDELILVGKGTRALPGNDASHSGGIIAAHVVL